MIACPGCGSNLRFDIASQQMKCEYCGESYDPARFAGMEKDAAFEAHLFRCPGCGAELITADETDATGFCPYCGGASILFDRLKKVEMPSSIVPFSVTKEQCRRAYRRAALGAVFTPARYKRAERIDSFRGIYMPFWSYRVEQKGEASIRADDTPRSEDGYTVTKHYDIKGQVDMSYDGYAHDASRAFDDEISECIKPFDVAKRKPFSPGYLSGFYADAADVPAEEFEDMASQECQERTAEMLLRDAGVNSCANRNGVSITDAAHVSVPEASVSSELVYYPVWFMSYREKDRITYAAVNGQTGKVVADFPVSPLRFLIAALLLAAVLFAGLNFFFTLKPEWALGITTVLMLLGVWLSGRSFSTGRLQMRRGAKLQRADRAKVIFLVVWELLLLPFAILLLSHEQIIPGAMLLVMAAMGLVIPGSTLRAKGFRVSREPLPGERTAFEVGDWAKTLAVIAALLAVLLIFVIKPVYNLWYYIPALIEAALLFVVFFQCFRHQLRLAMRRPPQFNKEGGDDRA